MSLLSYHITPIQEVQDAVLERAGIRLLIKREDLNHPLVSGNKWWKLKFNLEAARIERKDILTFGGAFSNHIYATAAAAKEVGLRSIGIIRGEETLPLNDTLEFASQMGMRLQYISRHAYRDKMDPLFVDQLKIAFGDFYMIPEGGSNELAVIGLEQFAKALNCNADYLCCPVGTGGTLAGIIRGLDGAQKIIGFSALKGGAFLNEAVRILSGKSQSNWEINTDYHFGGYAKSTTSLEMFIKRFMEVHLIPLEFIYTGKMMSGIFDLAAKGFFARGSTVLAIHTGGIRPHK